MNVTLNGPLEKTDSPGWESFLADAGSVIGLVLGVAERSAHRLAFVAGEVATTRVFRAMPVAAVARRLISIPEGVDQDSLFEWEWRAPHRTEVDGERYNLLPRVTAMTGSIAIGGADPTSFDGLHFEMDVNTHQGNARPRFGPNELAEGFATLRSLQEDLLLRVSALVGDF